MLCSAYGSGSGERPSGQVEAGGIGLRHASLLISLVVMLFAAMLLATPPLALLTVPPDQPATAPMVPVGATATVSQLA